MCTPEVGSVKIMPTGMDRATPTTCSTQRASHAGSRFGHCSNKPNASIAKSPTSTVRMKSAPDCQLRPSIRPKTMEKASVSRTRPQPSIEAKPRGFAGIAGAITARG
jgi:hypothetical protein